MNTYFLTGEEYDLQYQGYKEDLNFYLSEIKKAKKTLEIGCGTGRILLPALQKGHRIEGLDGSRPMLKTLNQKAKNLDIRSKTYFADMRHFNLKKKYDLIIVPFRAFLHLQNVKEQKLALLNFRKHLLPKGKLILNFFNPDYKRLAGYRGKEEFLSIVKEPTTKNKVKMYAVNCYYSSKQLVKSTFIHKEVNKHNLPVSSKKYTLKIRYIFRFEFEHLLELTSFKALKLYGDFKRGKFTDKAREMVWICQKA